MTEQEARKLIRRKELEELVKAVNDSIDLMSFPLCEIKEIDDEDQWDKIGESLGGSSFRTLLKKYPEPERAVYFMFNSESYEILYFRNKKDLLEVYEDYLVDEHIDTEFETEEQLNMENKEQKFHNERRAFYLSNENTMEFIPEGLSHLDYFCQINHPEYIESKLRGYVLRDHIVVYIGKCFMVPDFVPRKIFNYARENNLKYIGFGCIEKEVGDEWDNEFRVYLKDPNKEGFIKHLRRVNGKLRKKLRDLERETPSDNHDSEYWKNFVDDRKLNVGDCLYCKIPGLYFYILDIDEKKNWVKVKVVAEGTGYEHEEEWDDLNNVYNALENGEYIIHSRKNDLGGLPYEITNPYPDSDYCFAEEHKGYGKYKNSGKPRKKRRK